MRNETASREIESLDYYLQNHTNDYSEESHMAMMMAIEALEQESIAWIVGKDNAQVAVRNMPIDKMQKICAIIREEEQQPCKDLRDATEEERKSTKDYIDSISKPTGLQFDDVYEELDFVQPHKQLSVNLHLCDDAISRKEVLDELDKYIDKAQSTGTRDDFISFQELVVKQLPSVTTQPKRGKWIQTKDDCDGVNFYDFSFECSKCGKERSFKSNYCPNCGAYMRESEVEE